MRAKANIKALTDLWHVVRRKQDHPQHAARSGPGPVLLFQARSFGVNSACAATEVLSGHPAAQVSSVYL
jgi:hypothetical protein